MWNLFKQATIPQAGDAIDLFLWSEYISEDMLNL